MGSVRNLPDHIRLLGLRSPVMSAVSPHTPHQSTRRPPTSARHWKLKTRPWVASSVPMSDPVKDAPLRKYIRNSRKRRTSSHVWCRRPLVHTLFASYQQLPVKHRVDFKIANITFRTRLFFPACLPTFVLVCLTFHSFFRAFKN